VYINNEKKKKKKKKKRALTGCSAALRQYCSDQKELKEEEDRIADI
jgi:hypothetical protein